MTAPDTSVPPETVAIATPEITLFEIDAPETLPSPAVAPITRTALPAAFEIAKPSIDTFAAPTSTA